VWREEPAGAAQVQRGAVLVEQKRGEVGVAAGVPGLCLGQPGAEPEPAQTADDRGVEQVTGGEGEHHVRRELARSAA